MADAQSNDDAAVLRAAFESMQKKMIAMAELLLQRVSEHSKPKSESEKSESEKPEKNSEAKQKSTQGSTCVELLREARRLCAV